MNETAIKLTGNKHELERKQKGNRKKNSQEIEKKNRKETAMKQTGNRYELERKQNEIERKIEMKSK